jgi:hypothetical protein
MSMSKYSGSVDEISKWKLLAAPTSWKAVDLKVMAGSPRSSAANDVIVARAMAEAVIRLRMNFI